MSCTRVNYSQIKELKEAKKKEDSSVYHAATNICAISLYVEHPIQLDLGHVTISG